MPSLLCQVRMPFRSGLPEEVSINTFSFLTGDRLPATLLEIQQRLSRFYNTATPPATNAVQAFLGACIDAPATRLKIYDRADAKPRAPIWDVSMPLAGTGGGNLPAEVAVVLSFRGPLESGSIAARRRGRIYLGPLYGAAGTQNPNIALVPSSNLRIALADAAKTLMDQSDGVADWSVHSDVAAPAVADTTIVHAWVDDAFDTQRRRGMPPTGRETRDRSGSIVTLP